MAFWVVVRAGVHQVAGHDGALRDRGQDLLRRRGTPASPSPLLLTLHTRSSSCPFCLPCPPPLAFAVRLRTRVRYARARCSTVCRRRPPPRWRASLLGADSIP